MGQVYLVLTFGVFDTPLGEAQSLLVTARKFCFKKKILMLPTKGIIDAVVAKALLLVKMFGTFFSN